MRREHVVVGGDDPEIGLLAVLERGLVAWAAGGEAVREVGAAQALAPRRLRAPALDPLEIAGAAVG
jgi:hypothetical protein